MWSNRLCIARPQLGLKKWSFELDLHLTAANLMNGLGCIFMLDFEGTVEDMLIAEGSVCLPDQPLSTARPFFTIFIIFTLYSSWIFVSKAFLLKTREKKKKKDFYNAGSSGILWDQKIIRQILHALYGSVLFRENAPTIKTKHLSAANHKIC